MIRFKKISRNKQSYCNFEIECGSRRIYISVNNPILRDWTDYFDNQYICEYNDYENWSELSVEDVSDFVNNLCFEIINSFGFEYNEEEDALENVVYTWDSNLIPGERFIGLRIGKLEGTEESIYDLFPNLTMNIDVLDSFRFDLGGYIGLSGGYRLYLPYTEENLNIYKNYLEYNISSRFPAKLKRKIKT